MVASVSAVPRICVKAPATIHGQNTGAGFGSVPFAASSARRKASAKGKPKRNRTCVAPAVPRLVVSSRCMALRAVCPPAASTVNATHNQAGTISAYADADGARPARK